MSKENVALFVRMVAEKRDLNVKATAEKSTSKWVQLGREAGLQFAESDVVGFVSEMLGRPVAAAHAVAEFLRDMTSTELDDGQLDAVVGGAGRTAAPATNFSPNLGTRMVGAGYTPPGGLGAQYVEFPPDPVPPQSINIGVNVSNGG